VCICVYLCVYRCIGGGIDEGGGNKQCVYLCVYRCIGEIIDEGDGNKALQDRCRRDRRIHPYMLTHTCKHIYIYTYVCVCVNVYLCEYRMGEQWQ